MMRKILVVAYACEPFKGSEQGVGWNWVLQLAIENKVSVITRANNESVIKNNIPAAVKENVMFYYYDTSSFFLKLKNRAKGLYVYYTFWQIGVLPLVKKLHREQRFDYVFQPTMGSIWMPTFIPLLKIPLIWGPLGGGECVPVPFLKVLPPKDRMIQFFRYLLKYFIFFNPFLLFSFFRAKVILVRTGNTRQFVPYWFRNKVKIILETAIEEDVFKYLKNYNSERKELEIIITGRLIPIKNLLLTLKAFFRVSNAFNITLKIIGEGNLKKRIEKEIANNPSNHKMVLAGNLSRAAVLEELAKGNIYLFPSLHEGGSWSLMEAMAVGLPVVCLNWTGNAVITDDSSAVRLEVTNPDQFCRDMTKAIEMLAQNPGLRRQIGESARKRIREKFNWEEKGKFMETLFSELEFDKGKNGKRY